MTGYYKTKSIFGRVGLHRGLIEFLWCFHRGYIET